MAITLTIPQSLFVSSGAVLERPERPLCILVPSMSTGQITLDFALSDPTQTAVASFSYYGLQRADWGAPTAPPGAYLVYSGAGPAISAPLIAPTPWIRLRSSVAQATTCSFAVIIAPNWS
jgi:hypothetical protein